MQILVVGAGFAGAVYGRCLAEAGHKVTIIDRRNHISGNAHDYVDAAGVRIHRYGPHLFHSNNKSVVDWLMQFGTFVPYEHSVTVLHGDKFLPLPISRGTFETYFDQRFATDAILAAFLERIVVPCAEPKNAADYLYSLIGRDLADLIFRPYTRKMWALDLEDMDAAVVRRVSIQYGYERRYFPNDAYQMLPRNGYDAVFSKILDHDNIKVQLSTAYQPALLRDFDHTFSSAAIDEHYDYKYGELPYRSIRFHHTAVPSNSTPVPTPVVNYSDTGSHTRETHWHMLPHHHVIQTGVTTRTVEEPCDHLVNGRERYYPIADAAGRNAQLYRMYKAQAAAEIGLDFIGRCGTYQYLDMHQVINQSLQGAKNWLLQQAGGGSRLDERRTPVHPRHAER